MEVNGAFPLQEVGRDPRIPIVSAAYLLAHVARSLSLGNEALFDTGGAIRGAIVFKPEASTDTVHVFNDYTGVGAQVPRNELLAAIDAFVERVRAELAEVLPRLSEDEVVGEWFRREGSWARPPTS